MGTSDTKVRKPAAGNTEGQDKTYKTSVSIPVGCLCDHDPCFFSLTALYLVAFAMNHNTLFKDT